MEANGNTATFVGLKPGKVTVTVEALDITKSVDLSIIGGLPKIEIQSGNNQFRNTSGYLDKNLKVRVTDDAGNPREGVELNWEMISGKGKLDNVVSITDVNGESENKFYIDYSNEKHDIQVSVASNKEISTVFLETLRLIPMGPENSWTHVGEYFWDYKKISDERTNVILYEGGTICYSSLVLSESCYSGRYFDKNQTDFYFAMGNYNGILNMKHYFSDGDTLYSTPIRTSFGTKNEFKNVKIIDDKNVIVQTYTPVWTGGVIAEFAGWIAILHYVERGKGIIRTEVHTPKSSWGDYSARPKSTEVPSLEDNELQYYWNLTQFNVVEWIK